MRIAVRIIIVLMLLYYVSSIIAKACICIPPQKLWKPELEGHCINNEILLLADCISSIVCDFLVLVLPMPLIWNLQLPVTKKLGLTAVFATGLLYVCR